MAIEAPQPTQHKAASAAQERMARSVSGASSKRFTALSEGERRLAASHWATHRPKDWILRLGYTRTIALVTLTGTIGSVLLSLLLTRLLGLGGGRGYIDAAVISTIVPLIMIPLTLMRIIRLTIDLEAARSQLHYLATHDVLTSAYNRAFFLSRFEAERQRAQKTRASLAILMIDLDDFKAINDCYGHTGGDLALEAIAGRIQNILRPQDLFARYGGEEFIALLPKTSLEEACRVAEQIRLNVAEMAIAIQKETVSITVSIGVSGVEQGLEQMIDRADAALYVAKRDGRNRWAC